MRWVLGIDPGLKGGFAALSLDDDTLDVRPADGPGGYLGPRAVLERSYNRALGEMAEARGCAPVLVVVEAVQLRPHQGLHSQARAAYGIGLIVGAVAARGWAFECPTPAHWHQLLGIPAGENPKEQVFAWCERRLPMLDLRLGGRRKPHDGVADAAALAYYGRLILAVGRRRQLTDETTN